MKHVIVSGATGHLGSELSHQLQNLGVQVVGLTRQSISEIRMLGEGQLLQIDGRTETILKIFHKVRPDAVFHLAGCSRREHQSSDIEPFVTANILLGIQLLEAMARTGGRHFVTAGTYLQHYDSDGYRAFNLYAATKQGFEDVIDFYADTYGISAVRLTLCDIYSEHDKRKKLMTDIIKAWTDSTPLHLADPHARIDLVHVEDAAAAFVRAAGLLENGDIPPGRLSRYSVSSGHDLTVEELVTCFERQAGIPLVMTHYDATTICRRIRPRRSALVPGWTPQIPLVEGIRRILASNAAATWG